MDFSISIAAIVISIVGLFIAFLSYKTSNDARKEASQLRLVDKVIECGLVAQTSMIMLGNVRNETKVVKNLAEKIDVENFEKSKIVNEISVVFLNLDSIENRLLSIEKSVKKITNTLDDLGVGKEKKSVHRLYSLYVDVSKLTADLVAQSRDLEKQSLSINSHKAVLEKYTQQSI